MQQLVVTGHMDTAANWRERRRLLLGTAKVYTRLRELIDGAKANEVSLAVFTPTQIKRFTWEAEALERDRHGHGGRIPGTTGVGMQDRNMIRAVRV